MLISFSKLFHNIGNKICMIFLKFLSHSKHSEFTEKCTEIYFEGKTWKSFARVFGKFCFNTAINYFNHPKFQTVILYFTKIFKRTIISQTTVLIKFPQKKKKHRHRKKPTIHTRFRNQRQKLKNTSPIKFKGTKTKVYTPPHIRVGELKI